MKATIAVYDHHNDAVKVLHKLKGEGFTDKQLSIIGKADKVDDKVVLSNKNLDKMEKVAGAEVGIGAALGTTLGALAGVGIFAIPGLGFLVGAGALVGAIAGFDIGLIGGGVVSALTLGAMSSDEAKVYEQHLKEGHHLVVIQGTEEEVAKAKSILETHGEYTHLEVH